VTQNLWFETRVSGLCVHLHYNLHSKDSGSPPVIIVSL